ncbi:uncharacterized protein LOC142537152 [Primulina tabacum]|uniref:uncharacterized protein LOC142537152 n=1 Tax=Primulina tabacum TaxID=48773 RepID=UPI003F59FB40
MTASTTIRRENRAGRHRGGRIGETAGDCAAIICCCPCATIHLLILALYRLPTGLCKKAWRRRRKRHRLLKKKKMMNSMEEKENQWKENSFGFCTDDCYGDEESIDQSDTVEWDSEIWDHFYAYGFWRSGSQRNEQQVNGMIS